MKLDAKAEALLKKLHTRRVEGDGYAVEIIMPMVVRYRKGARSLTLGCEPRGSALDIYVETPAAWDNEPEAMNQPELDEAISRIKRALAEKKLRYEFFLQGRSRAAGSEAHHAKILKDRLLRMTRPRFSARGASLTRCP